MEYPLLTIHAELLGYARFDGEDVPAGEGRSEDLNTGDSAGGGNEEKPKAEDE